MPTQPGPRADDRWRLAAPPSPTPMALLARAGKLAAIPQRDGMKTHSNTAPRNAQAQAPNHPPLARDGYGNPQAIPEGAAGWRLKRETGGRPKTIVGADRQPARFPIDITADDIEEMVGAGTYRVYAIGADGEVLDYVTTVGVGEPAPAEPEPAPASPGPLRGAGSDLRFALETILQMSRAQADSLKAVALAQADWVKGLASAKALPRNGYPVMPQPPAYRVRDEEDEEDEDDDNEDDDSGNDDEPAEATSPWLGMVTALTPILQTYGQSLMQKVAPAAPTEPAAPAEPPPPHNASPEQPAEGPDPVAVAPNPMIHLSEINVRLTAFERKFLNALLRGNQGDQVTDLLIAMSVDEAAAFVKENIARVQAERDAATRAGGAPPAKASPTEASPTDSLPAETPPVETRPAETRPARDPCGVLGFMPRVLAASAYLTAEEKAAVMWLVPRFPAARFEELKVKLLRMTPRDAAMWIRENLAALRAEVPS